MEAAPSVFLVIVLWTTKVTHKGDINSRQLFPVVTEGQDFALGLVFANSDPT